MTKSTPTNRTIYLWVEVSKIKSDVHTTKQTTWTQAVRNRMIQKAGEIQVYRAYEKGAEKWRTEQSRAVGRMDESDLGQITRPKENGTDELPHIPNELLDPQDHEGKRIRQMRPM